jgi:hypothetical protein
MEVNGHLRASNALSREDKSQYTMGRRLGESKTGLDALEKIKIF